MLGSAAGFEEEAAELDGTEVEQNFTGMGQLVEALRQPPPRACP
ncbi:hypothetical protein [Yinghuangia sp. YIM S09857]